METEAVTFLVIIPTYKRQHPLGIAIKSALRQTGITKRIIVADDCPNGSAAEVVRAFPEVVYIRNPEPSGGWPGRVRNFAFACSREMGIAADYVHFLDDDDTVPEQHYALLNEAFCKHPEVGVIFGVLRPFCEFSDDPTRRERQELQLQEVRAWRVKATRFPWCYQQIGEVLKLPAVTQWFFSQHALFGEEMFLCSGGVLRYPHVMELGGFPDIRITEDYSFYTDAIRRFGALFLKKETAGYGVGHAGALWSPLDLEGAAKAAHTDEWKRELRIRQRKLRTEMGHLKYYIRMTAYFLGRIVLTQVLMPMLDRWGYFADLHRLVDPDRFSGSAKHSYAETPSGAETRALPER